MPAQPTWPQVAEFAARLDQGEGQRRGICLRGKPGWGEVIAPLDTVINTFGGRWFDPEWRRAADLPGVAPGREFYVDLVARHGEPGAATRPASPSARPVRPGPGRHVVRRDVGRQHRRGPAESTVAGQIGYAPAPVVTTHTSGWLYSWSLAIPETSAAQGRGVEVRVLDDEQALHRARRQRPRSGGPRCRRAPASRRTRSRSTSRCRAPTASRSCRACSGRTRSSRPCEPVPYTGMQFVRIPEFQDLGTRVASRSSRPSPARSPWTRRSNSPRTTRRSVGECYQR